MGNATENNHEGGLNYEILVPHAQTVAILNFGSQHTLEIYDSIRNQGVHAEVLPYDTPASELAGHAAVVLSGGDSSIYNREAPRPDPAVLELDMPLMGICYGAQLLAFELGGNVIPGEQSEFQQHKIRRTNAKKEAVVFAPLQDEQAVWMNHGDRITQVPESWEVSAESENGMVAAFHSPDNRIVGLQFHPEIHGEDRTENSADIWARFLFDVAKIEPSFEPEDLETRVTRLKTEIDGRHVLAFLSGGVDSTVMAALLAQAVPAEQISAVHIDHGFMRENESDEVILALTAMGVNVKKYDASEFFLGATTVIDGVETSPLREVASPEIKRKIIGDAFIRYQELLAQELGLPDDYVLAQGSIRPDLIESGSHGTVTIKSHHNDSPLARQLRLDGRVVEPLADLYKPGVRALGRALGLTDALVERQPFPGPGLAIRILCSEGMLSELATDELYEAARTLGGFTATLAGITVTPIRSVGQRGEARSYGRTVVLSGDPDWPYLMDLARDISQANADVTRVTYAFGEIMPESVTTLLTPTMLGVDVARQLRQADSIVRQELTKANLDLLLQQVPVILLPSGIDKPGLRSIVIRPFLTSNFMTGTPAQPGTEAMPVPVLARVVQRLSTEVTGIGRVLYDLTGKPPGTTEWE